MGRCQIFQLDTVVLEGSILVHLLKSWVIQAFCLGELVLPGEQAQFSYPKCLPIQNAKSERKPATVLSAMLGIPPPHWAPGQHFLEALSISRPMDSPEIGVLHPVLFLFVELGPSCSSLRSWQLHLRHQGLSHLLAVPCQSHPLEGVLLCQRTHTSIKLRSKWPEPVIREVLLVLLPIKG